MDTDKQQLVTTADKEAAVAVDIIVIRQVPNNVRRTVVVRLLVSLLLIAPLFAVLCVVRGYFSSSDSQLDDLKYKITFDSVTEHITDDPANRVLRYHVISPDHEVWALHDFDAGVHVIKVADADRLTNCYVTSLDAVTDEDYGSPVITDTKVNAVGVVSFEIANNVREETVTFQADISPITDAYILGKTGQELCQGHTTYQMRKDELSSNDFGTELDPNLPVLRTYTINHRDSAASLQGLTLPQQPLVVIDSTGLRVRRQEREEEAQENNTTEEQHLPSAMESRVFKLWDYFSRRRPRTRRELPEIQLGMEITDDDSFIGSDSNQSTASRRQDHDNLLGGSNNNLIKRPPGNSSPVRHRRQLPSSSIAVADQATNDDLSRPDAMLTNYRVIDRYRRRRQRRSSSTSRVLRQVDNIEWPRQEILQWPQQHEGPPLESEHDTSRVAGNYGVISRFRFKPQRQPRG